MCEICVAEHEEYCQEHVNTCEIGDGCKMCAAIWRGVRDGKIYVDLPE
ncbi:endolysin [Streptomyces phage Coruscant]|uniref:Endolysin n=1 Tax=Streptomyces phage Coruscant TaxID=2739834 RepID=A0A7G4AVU3_9CAUD|nr:endolysin [Streptomyces phage Coruscant]YP_010651592.1 endolysin [Streptomyces phage Coruscant]QMP84133.1 endolysin [Streptomyces phage Coruscant]QMP84357.1 endolysin [Streptomyces phage Coruscant]